MQDPSVARTLLEEAERHLCEVSKPRIEKCLAELTEEEVWRRPNAQTVSVGNLVLHLCGNVRQWICAGLGGQRDTRHRDAEFAEQGPMPTEQLLEHLDTTLADARAVLRAAAPESLLDVRRVQVYEQTGVQILVHVTEHFSYHVGQVTYYVKSRKAVDLGYYAGQDLNAPRE